ncbi:glutaredoxin domain-containing protein [Mobilicoccus pelagius]|uniref:Glutaredoxin domain-containing protein n=1 Tax=Mobilicoccus pelagius NBRC 104925 TaxID=1089455 RepID=H5UNF0_9MICO|nr:glutaredoxin domain-containing protein [Mobilicoccus pelagius]GAB47258.1 hypothetical protein MOPEL_007_00740 [Mobilicoccus pelagius NBRC 104925]
MSRSQRARWWNTAALVGGGVLLVSVLLLLEWHVAAAVVAVVLAALLWRTAPRATSPSPRHWDAQERLVREERVIVYWRPGCLFCTRLRLRLGSLSDEVTWVDIWSDPAAAAFVRDLNGGAETVPTVILPDGEARTNPDPNLVRGHLVGLRKVA